MKLTVFSLLALLSATTTAFAMGGKPLESRTDASGRFTVSEEVPENQAKLMLQDIQYMQAMGVRSLDPELLKVMELREANASTLSQWLSDRVQYVISDKIDLEKALFPVQENYPFENPGILPDLGGASAWQTASVHDASKAVVVMSNMGAALYMAGKMNRILIGIDLPGIGKVSVTSPRSGIIQIGEGHFLPMMKKKGGGEKIETEAYSQFRLATLFHEARHSDGNGKSLGFAHAKCPAGHDYAGLPACDRNLNGPYTVGALVSRTMVTNCTNCSAAEKEALKLNVLDSFSRVVKQVKKGGSGSDATTEKLCQDLRDLNKKLTNPIELPDFCNTPAQPGGEVIVSTWWDARPEGRR